jgi:hypothetical protein
MSYGWDVQLEPAILLPDRRASVSATYTPARDHDARRVVQILRCVERWVYSRDETQTNADGHTSVHRVTRTDSRELHRSEVELAGEMRFVRGQPQRWTAELQVPPLGPASFEGSVLRCDWTLEIKIDIPRAMDEGWGQPVHVAQPMALLRAGVVDIGQYGLYDVAAVNLDALPAQVSLEPVPIDLTRPFSGRFTVETDRPIEVQEVRVELRVRVQVTVPGGHQEEITVARARLVDSATPFGGALAQHDFTADAPNAWLPAIDLPHGRARAILHVILARPMAPDIHYQRDVALATTSDL